VTPALRGRRCVVTGASGGIGEAIAHTLVEHGADVVVIAREGPRLGAARDRLRDVRRGAKVQAIGADLALQAEVRRIAATLGTDPVDVLVLNAAVIPAARVETRDGIEQTLAVNHLAPFLLTQLLRPRFTPRTRVVVVGADPGWSSREPVDLDDLAFSERRRRATAAHTLDVERQGALWSASEALTGSYA